MAKFTFDVEMFTSITVEADSAEAAADLLCDKLDQAEVTFGSWENGEPILGQIGLPEDAATLSFTDSESAD